MANEFTAFPLLGERLPDYARKLLQIPDCNFWIHEKQIVAYLRLPRGQMHGSSNALTTLLACTKKGFGGAGDSRQRSRLELPRWTWGKALIGFPFKDLDTVNTLQGGSFLEQ